MKKLIKRRVKQHGYLKDKVLFISIPKNNNKLWRQAADLGIKERVDQHTPRDLDGCFAFVRDPHQRVVSGLRQWLHTFKGVHGSVSLEQMLYQFDKWIDRYDEHLERQITFIPTWGHVELFPFDQQHRAIDYLIGLRQYGWAENIAEVLHSVPWELLGYLDVVKEIVQKHYPEDWALWKKVKRGEV